MFGFGKKAVPVAPPVSMTLDELSVIVAVAKGKAPESVRERAVQIYRSYLRILSRHDDIYMAFMSEEDNPAKDLALRWRWRTKVLEDSASRGIVAFKEEPVA